MPTRPRSRTPASPSSARGRRRLRHERTHLSGSISEDPNVLVAQCMDTLAEMVKEGQAVPIGFSCWPGGTPDSIVVPKSLDAVNAAREGDQRSMIRPLFDFVRDAAAAVIGVDRAAAEPRVRAYREAWKRRRRSKDSSPTILEDVLRERRVPGAFGPHDAPEVALMFQAWEGNIPPRAARKTFGRTFIDPSAEAGD